MSKVGARDSQTTALTALIVDPVAADREFAARTLEEAGFRVDLAGSFDEADACMTVRPPSVLLADVRLGEYNGLHLILRAHAAQPGLAALVTYDVADPVLQADADRLGATFITKPVSARELVAATFRTLLRLPDDSTPVHPPFERRTGERRGTPAAIGVPNRRIGERRRIT